MIIHYEGNHYQSTLSKVTSGEIRQPTSQVPTNVNVNFFAGPEHSNEK